MAACVSQYARVCSRGVSALKLSASSCTKPVLPTRSTSTEFCPARTPAPRVKRIANLRKELPLNYILASRGSAGLWRLSPVARRRPTSNRSGWTPQMERPSYARLGRPGGLPYFGDAHVTAARRPDGGIRGTEDSEHRRAHGGGQV